MIKEAIDHTDTTCVEGHSPLHCPGFHYGDKSKLHALYNEFLEAQFKYYNL
jgi:hypothetical protein